MADKLLSIRQKYACVFGDECVLLILLFFINVVRKRKYDFGWIMDLYC